jgi:uncharacterized protein (UPF0332 family)
MVLIDETNRTIEEAGSLVHQSLQPYYKRFSIDPFIVPVSKWLEYQKKGSPFLQLILKEGKLLYMKDITEEWVKQAREELNMAKYLLRGEYFKGACYHAQQSVEKALKASLFRKGWELEKTHSAARLIAIGKELKVKFPLTEDDILLIDSIYRGRNSAEAGLLCP